MARKGRKSNPEKELQNLILSMESLSHKGQYPSLTTLIESILNYSHAKRKRKV